MSTVSDIYSSMQQNSVAKSSYAKGSETSKKTSGPGDTDKTSATEKTEKKVKTGLGRTVGDAGLSEKAAEYYKKLKEKFKDMDFVLVANDKKDMVKKNPAAYVGNAALTVLIDEEKLERMATDKEFAAKYEKIIETAGANLNKLSENLKQSGNANGVTGYGAVIKDDGTVEYFAVVDKQLAAQQARIAEKQAEKKADKKAQAKKEAKEEAEERIKERIEERKENDGPFKPEKPIGKPEDMITLKAGSVEELMQKLSDTLQDLKVDSVRTPEEMAVGGSIDFKG